MILLCNVCQPTDKDWHYHDKGVLAIAKWYPVGSYAPIIDAEIINKFLEEHSHPEMASEFYTEGAGQPNPVRLVYESVDLPVVKPTN